MTGLEIAIVCGILLASTSSVQCQIQIGQACPGWTSTTLSCDCQKNNFTEEVLTIKQPSAVILQVENCQQVKCSGFMMKSLQNATFRNISKLEFFFPEVKFQRSRRDAIEPVSYFELSSSSLDVFNGGIFYAKTFSKIILQNSKIGVIEREAFAIIEASEIIIDDVSITQEIASDAFSNVTLKKFSMKNSFVKRINPGALKLVIQEELEMSNNTFDRLTSQALHEIHAENDGVNVTFEHNQINHFEDESLCFTDSLATILSTNGNFQVTKNLLKKPCACEDFAIFHHNHNQTLHYADNSFAHGLMRTMYCIKKGEEIAWYTFDLYECDAEHDHGIFSLDTKKGLTAMHYILITIGLFLIVGVPIIVTVIVGRCFRQTQILPVLPGNFDCSQHDDSWQYSFQMSSRSSKRRNQEHFLLQRFSSLREDHLSSFEQSASSTIPLKQLA